MNTIKSLILGSAAGLLAIGGAQAADLPVKAKAVEYVKVCSLYGAGFYYMPGTDTCIKFGGYLRVDSNFNGIGTHGGIAFTGDPGAGDRFRNVLFDRSRLQLNVDTRTATEYGVVRTFGIIDAQLSVFGGPTSSPTGTVQSLAGGPILDGAGAGTVVPELLFIQFAGFTFGKSFSPFMSPWAGYPSNQLTSYLFGAGGNNTTVGQNNVQYTADFGGGLSSTIGLLDPTQFTRASLFNLSQPLSVIGGGTAGYGGARMPDIAANVKLDQAWGLFQLSGYMHEVDASYNTLAANGTALNTSSASGYPNTKYGGAVQAALQIKNIPTGPGDDIKMSAVFAKGNTGNVFAVAGGSTPNFAMYGSGSAGTLGSLAFGTTTDAVYAPVASGGDGQLHLTTSYGFQGGFTHNWNPQWSSSLFGAMVWEKYDSSASASFCTNYAANTGGVATQTNFSATGTYTCNPNFSVAEVGVNARWTPVKGLAFSTEMVFFHLASGFSGTANLTPPGIPYPTGTYQFKNQNTAEIEFRVQRDF